MKKICYIFFIVITSMLMASCSGESNNQQNHIRQAELSSEQQYILNFITTHYSEIHLFDFTTDESFTNVEFWLDVYEYGMPVDSIPGIHQINNAARPLDGRLAVIINSENGNRDFQWTFIADQGGGRATSRFESPTINNAGYGRMFGPILEPINIQDDREIILYISKFASDGLRIHDNIQIFAEQPELLAEYPYVHIIKARFSR